MIQTENLQFKVSSALKNIIGKDLILDDYIAIFELVKNSYDAHATNVHVTFKSNSIVIQDNGKGMSKDDLVKKWLFVAYSAKYMGTEDKEFLNDEKYSTNEFKDYRDKINSYHGYAGAKGIGRFSCDRLGQQLRLISRKIGEPDYHQLDIDWEKFENNPEDEFVNIDVNYSIPTNESVKKYDDFQHGLVLEIKFLRDSWEREHKLELKRSLGKLINPFENSLMPSFKIELHDKEEFLEDSLKTHDKDIVNGIVKNTVIDILNIKTTYIEVHIENNKIITTLTDRGELIYKVSEINKFPMLKNIHFRLFFLNRAAKNNFYRQMGIRAVEFGSVFLYNNGFRVYPFGEIDKDSLGIDQRHQQGYARYLGTRDLLGSIEILQKSEHFREASSREGGLIKSDGTQQLIEAFYDYVLKRLEKYVVGVQWAFEDDYRLRDDKDREDLSLLNTITSKQKIIELISRLVDNDETQLLDYNKDFLNIVDEKIAQNSPEILKNLQKLALKTNDHSLIDEIQKANQKILDLQKSLMEAEEQARKSYENQAKAEQRAEKAEIEVKSVIEEKQKIEQVKQKQDEQLLFLKSIQSLDKDQLINFQHHIGLYANTIQDTIEGFRTAVDKNQILSKDEINQYLKKISLNTQKILAINKYATKANFLSSSQTIQTNLVAFIDEYLSNVYDATTSNNLNIQIAGQNIRFVKKFKPMEMTIIIDNLLSNSRKAKAKRVSIAFEQDGLDLLCIYSDDGKGLDSSIVNKNDIFNIGFTTTRGSGLGLYHIREIIASLKGTIEVGDTANGIEFIIRLKNDT
ncbi:ATP-binding protein [Sulfuricurvum sp. RIFOXYD2_FULL_44_160]|uniref:ATP-binding protein n=1 Tax=Sulfuricurvum sp. RIFOXYD2_FULL_44_160 TaxID=1802249 RepID=UPI000A8CA0D1|nr:ATP-binding protein [Sulfuricurvum sp. RIFOXYD2_FULL_44_160]